MVRVLCALCASAVMLCAEPRRMVSTAPSVTEMLYALGWGDRVVGVTTFCRYPPEAARKPKVGDYLRPNLESILALKPDLVIVETTGIRRTERLPALRLKVLEVNDGTLAGICDSIRKIGAAAGVPERAAALCRQIQAALEDVRRSTAGWPRRRLMFVAGRAPGRLEELIVVGRGSHLNELIDIAGAANAFGDLAAAYAKVSLEQVLARNPEVIVDMGEMADTAGVTEEQKRAVLALWNAQPALAAVKRRGVFAVAADAFVVPGPRIVEAARELARLAHPEVKF